MDVKITATRFKETDAAILRKFNIEKAEKYLDLMEREYKVQNGSKLFDIKQNIISAMVGKSFEISKGIWKCISTADSYETLILKEEKTKKIKTLNFDMFMWLISIGRMTQAPREVIEVFDPSIFSGVNF